MRLAISMLTQRFSASREVVYFLLVGFFTAVIYFLLFSLLWELLHINYKVAVSVGYTSGVLFQFIMNRQLTFKRSDKNIWGQGLKFIVLLVINYILTIYIVSWSVESIHLSPYLGIVISVGVTVFVGFLFSKFWVYK